MQRCLRRHGVFLAALTALHLIFVSIIFHNSLISCLNSAFIAFRPGQGRRSVPELHIFLDDGAFTLHYEVAGDGEKSMLSSASKNGFKTLFDWNGRLCWQEVSYHHSSVCATSARAHVIVFSELFADVEHETAFQSCRSLHPTVLLISPVIAEQSHAVQVQHLNRPSLIFTSGQILKHEPKKSWFERFAGLIIQIVQIS